MRNGHEAWDRLVPRSLRTPGRLLWLFVLLVCGSVFGITGWRLLHARDLELGESGVASSNLARSLADHADGVVRDADIVLGGLVERLQVAGMSGAALARMHQFLVARVAAVPTIHHLVVFSAAGDALTASFDPMPAVNVADRAYFAFHRDHPTAGPLVGPPVRNRADGRWSLTVSRRFDGPGGAFGGVVVAVVDCDTFARFYAGFDVGARGSITLLNQDNTFVVRHPPPLDPDYRNTRPTTDYWGQGPVGTGRFVSPLDGVMRLYSFRKADRAPLVVVVALSKDDVLAAWRRDAWVTLAACSAISAALILLGWGLASQIRRREQREVAVRRSEELYRLLAEHSTDVIVHLGADCRRRYVSPASERLLGYRPEEMLGRHPRDITHPEDWPALEAKIAEILRSGHAAPIDYRMRGKDGRYLWVEALGRRLDGDRGHIVTVRDATHRKDAEGRLREEIAAREAAQAQLAHARRLEALGQLAGGIAHDFNNVLQAVQGGARLIERRPADPEAVRRLARMVSEAAGRGAAITRRLLAFSRRGDLRAEAVDPAALLADLHEMFGHTLGAGVEVRVEAQAGLPPLLADKGQLETVLVNLATNARDAMSGEPPGSTPSLQAIHREAIRPAERNVEGRFVGQSEGFAIAQRSVPKGGTLGEALASSEKATPRGSDVAEGGEAPPCRPSATSLRGIAEGDEARAPKGAPERGEPPGSTPGGGVLTLSAALKILGRDGGVPGADRPLPAALKAGRYLRLAVSDTGSGMPPEVLARVAEPFFTTKPPGKGTGLGLAMAKGFAEQSGGALAIESAPGRGTTVALWLPVAAGQTVVPPSPEAEAARPFRGGRGRILLVDDDAAVRRVTAEQLEEAGYAVLPADAGPAALALLDAGEAVDLLVSDLSMPGMDGVAVIREAQRRRKGLPAILLTGFATNAAELAVGGALSGTFSLLRKPIEAHALAERAAMLLEGAAATAEAGTG